MGNIQFQSGSILMRHGPISMHPHCCCTGLKTPFDCNATTLKTLIVEITIADITYDCGCIDMGDGEGMSNGAFSGLDGVHTVDYDVGSGNSYAKTLVNAFSYDRYDDTGCGSFLERLTTDLRISVGFECLQVGFLTILVLGAIDIIVEDVPALISAYNSGIQPPIAPPQTIHTVNENTCAVFRAISESGTMDVEVTV